MYLQSTLRSLALATFTCWVVATPVPVPDLKTKPAAFFLAGDSTTAVQATNGGGWGTGFLTTTLRHDATGQNFGHNGATTVSFRAGGDWSSVLDAASSSLPNSSPYVTIQFGHNDQKPEKNISMAQFTANLVAFVEEVRAVPAVPILVTSLSRRRWSTSTGMVNENLKDVVDATKEAARVTGAALVDLNKASTAYLNNVGEEKAATYNLAPTDFTHLNAEGSVVFGNMMAMLIEKEIPGLNRWLKPVKKVEKALKRGEYIFPEV